MKAIDGGPGLPEPADEHGHLRDGTRVVIRSARPSDRSSVVEFLSHLSSESLELRYFSAANRDVAIDEILPAKSSPDRLSLLMRTVDPLPGKVIGHGEYVRAPQHRSRAEAAFLIADEFQGLGAGTLLLLHLARRGRSAGVRYFDAVVLVENRPMLGVFTGTGFPCIVASEAGDIHVTLDIAQDPPMSLALFGPPHDAPAAAT
jgi:acetate---CoA ligase (ADP-forming)